ncbi:MAG: metal-binding protein [Cyanobacteria bacterium P01_G01_bin.54]
MPAGKTHDRITLWSLPGIVVLALFCTRNATLALIISGMYLFGGLMFGPDLDIYSLQYKRWGWLRWLWLPYQRSIRHRSRLSHGFMVGTCLRLVYFLSFCLLNGVVGVAIAQLLFGFTWNWQAVGQGIFATLREHGDRFFAVFVGLELGAMSHVLADHFDSRKKRLKKAKQARQAEKQAQIRNRKFKP